MKLGAYLVRRLLLLIPVLLGVSVFIFALTRIGGDPGAAYITEKMNEQQIAGIYEQYHLNEPIHIQYWYWLDGIFHGDWGYSKTARAPVTSAIATYFPATFELTLVSILIAVVVGISLGTISAVKKDKPVDHATRVMALSGVSLPIFWLALILQYVFYYQLDLFPSGGRYDTFLYLEQGPVNAYTGFYTVDTLLNGNLTLFGDALMHLALPAVTLSFGTIAIITRMMRSSMLEVLGQDYVKTARSKGLPERVVIRKHARKNALIPTTTVVGLAFGGLLTGAVLTETIFYWPGMGQWSTAAILVNDWASILGFVLVVAIIYVIANLIVDVLYAYLDPRVRLG
ncbi:MAG: ABC transporter permease [Methanomassiliicoccales archaeon]|nr:ABC transporter permease [Methanomassiliicoccales archaeon]